MRMSRDRGSQVEGQQCKGPRAGTSLLYLRTIVAGGGERGGEGVRVGVKEKPAQTGDLGTWAIVRTLSLTLNEVEPVEGFD